MNKYQEALERAKICGDVSQCYECKYNDVCINDRKGWYGTLKELVDKATPKKPIKLKLDYMEAYVCPNCRHTYEGSSYCRFCGQLFDRSENEKS